jgi:hypothetical protein
MLAFETAHPDLVEHRPDGLSAASGEAAPGSSDLEKYASVWPGIEPAHHAHKKAVVAHNVGAKHHSKLEADYAKLKNKVVVAGIACEVLRDTRMEIMQTIADFEKSVRERIARQAEEQGCEYNVEFEWN